MKHPHVQVLEKIYSDFSQGAIQSVLDACSDTMTFQVPGKSKLAGKYTKETFNSGFVTQLAELSGGTFKLEIHDIMASDRHAVVLASDFVDRNGKTVQLRTAHIWRFENGKPVAWYEYPRDLYQFDSTWENS